MPAEEHRPVRPPTSCLVAGWLVGVKHPGRLVVAEVLALAEDGYVQVVADEDGYLLHRGAADPAQLSADRAELLAGLFYGEDPARLTRPALPPLVQPHGPISVDRLSTAVTRTAERHGFVSRLGWLVVAGVSLGIGAALLAFHAGHLDVAVPLITGTALFGSAWLRSPVPLSRTARTERDRLHELRNRLRESHDARDPALLPWAFLLLPGDEVTTWWRRARPVSDLPRWLTWRPTRAGAWPGLLTDSGLYGLIRALAHRIGP